MQENIAQQQDAIFYRPIYYWQFNCDAQAQTGFSSPEPFRVLLSDIIFPQVFTSHSSSNSRVSEVSKIAFTFFMMSEARCRNVVFFSKRSIVIKLPVMINLGQTSCFQCINGLSDMEKVCRTGKVSGKLGSLN